MIYPDSRYGCLAYPGNEGTEHRSRIWKLAGDGTTGDGTGSTTDSQPTFAPQLQLDVTWPVDTLARLIADHSYWNRRGISDETMTHFRGGVATTGFFAGRYVIPIFNDDHSLIVGFTGRRINEEGLSAEQRARMKWKHKNPTSKWVWGGVEEVEESRRAILVESPGDLLAMWENGIRDTLCLFGTNVSQAILGKLISANVEEIIVATNRDLKHNVGQQAAEKAAGILRKFWNSDRVRVVLPDVEGKKDWGEYSAGELENLKNLLDTPVNSLTME